MYLFPDPIMSPIFPSFLLSSEVTLPQFYFSLLFLQYVPFHLNPTLTGIFKTLPFSIQLYCTHAFIWIRPACHKSLLAPPHFPRLYHSRRKSEEMQCRLLECQSWTGVHCGVFTSSHYMKKQVTRLPSVSHYFKQQEFQGHGFNNF